MGNKKKRKIWPWVLIAILVVAAFLIVTFFRNVPNTANLTAYDTYTVTQGNIVSTITGSGKLESVDSETIDIPSGITISEVMVKAGDSISAGQTLGTLDIDSLKDRAGYLSDELSSIDKTLGRLSGSKTTDYVYSNVKGRLKYIPVIEGGDVISSIAQYGSLALISTDGLMQVEITTNQEHIISSEVTVKWQDGSETGEILAKTANGYMVTLADDEAPYNETAKVYSGSTLIGEGVLDIHLPVAIYANGGTISEIRYDLNDNVGTDYRLFKLENGPFSNSYQQKFSERTDLAKQLETILKYQNDPRIFAAKAGVISQVSIEAGMETGTGSSSGDVTAFVMYIGGAQKMIISVDELDIHSVSLEQEANISLDAISSEKFSAKVTHISKMGRAEGSITKFEVELTLSPDTRFLIGMNGNAEIITGEAEDVLIIPIEAINEDSTGVFVYTGVEREKTYISTGLSDGEFAEITNGLSEGDDIQYISSVSSNNPFGNMNTMPGPPFGGQGFAGGEPTNDN